MRAVELRGSSEKDSTEHSAFCRRVWGGSNERCGAAEIFRGGQRQHCTEGADRATHLQPAPSMLLHPAAMRGCHECLQVKHCILMACHLKMRDFVQNLISMPAN